MPLRSARFSAITRPAGASWPGQQTRGARVADEEIVELVVKAEPAVVDDDDDDDVADGEVTSIEDIDEGDDDDDDEPLIADDLRTEQLVERAVPQQGNEFVCMSCFLVRHKSQLADPKKQYCQDCA